MEGAISTITDAVCDAVLEWQHRPLEAFYPVIYLDAIRIKIRRDHTVENRAAHLAVGVDMEGIKHVLGIWVQADEGAAFWAHVCAEPANRGVRDVLIVCYDRLAGLPEIEDKRATQRLTDAGTPQQTNSPHTPHPRTHHHQLETSPRPTPHHLPRPNHPLPLTPIHRKTDRLHRAQCSIHRNEANTTNYKSDFPARQSRKVTLPATRFVHPHSWSQPTKIPTFPHHKAEKLRSQQHDMSYNPKDTLPGASTA